MKDMVDHAYRHNYAVGAFAVVDLEFLQGIMAAAERCRAPVILSLRESPLESSDFELLVSAVERAAQRASVPVAIHMHHGHDIESAVRAINQGCNGVMVDASHRELGDNIELSREVVATARGCGVPVEGNLGLVPEADGDGVQPDASRIVHTSVAEARGYVDKTGVDFLAVSIGTVRGRTKAKPKLNWQRLKQLNEALDMPLAIYGGTGLNDSQYGRLIANGVAKIDYYTALAEAAFEQVRSSTKCGARGGYATAMCAVREAVENETERCLRVCGAAGRAAEVLEQCRHWTPVEHIVTHNVQGMTDRDVEALMEEGRHMLSTIPGVLDVCSVNMVREDEIFRCNWMVRFCHPAVVDSYREHPEYLTFVSRRPRLAPHVGLGAPARSWGASSAHASAARLGRLSEASRG